MANNLDWANAVDLITPHVVRIATPQGSGTGFMLANPKHQNFVAVATAAHVIDQAHFWEQPMRLAHISSANTALLRPADRAVFLDEAKDTAVFLFNKTLLPLPDAPLRITPEAKYLAVGNDVGWLGFPAVAPGKLCFFAGRVSYFDDDRHSYLVDGVAINGVSGGPTFFLAGPSVIVIGVVSAYIANRATGETLPGLSVVQDVTQFQELLKTINSLDQAKAEERPLPDAAPPPVNETPGSGHTT